MKQIIQHLDKGKTELINIPAPSLKKDHLVIETTRSLISPGTERMLVDFGKASYFQKAKQQPEKVRMVARKIKTDGLLSTFESVKSKLSQPIPLGYSNVGIVREICGNVADFKLGDRVVSNGPHAEIVRVPPNLCAKIPDNVDEETAVFTVLSAIALQGVRLAQPTLGETFAVIGTGLIGLLTIQILHANGCNVIALDFDASRLSIAKSLGASTVDLSSGEDPISKAMSLNEGNGIDGVLITAATQSSDPVTHAANMCRKRGRIILVGVSGLTLNRADFYEKELSFQVSCSYGPGRYDPKYEEEGQDYPLGFVRWTEQRNFQAILNLMSRGEINVSSLVTHRYDFEQAAEAYDVLTSEKSALAIMLDYNKQSEQKQSDLVSLKSNSPQTKDRENSSLNSEKEARVSFIGAGNYAIQTLIPCFKTSGAELVRLVTTGSINSTTQGKRAGFKFASSNTEEAIIDDSTNTIVIATRHNTHAEFVQKSLLAGKHVFVEKPLAINKNELEQVSLAYQKAASTFQAKPQLMVGFNRRFSPFILKMKTLLDQLDQPMNILMTINAGHIPADHWVQDPNIGGGRIIGEACHFIDLSRFLAGSPICDLSATCLGSHPGIEIPHDKASIQLKFENGSVANILYLSNGSTMFPKERIEVFCSGKILQLNNFKSLKGFGWPNFSKMTKWKQDKGHQQAVNAFLSSITEGSTPPIPIDQIIEVTQATLKIDAILKNP